MLKTTLHDDYITALLLLRSLHLRFIEPVSIEYLRGKFKGVIIIQLVKDGLALVFEDYYLDESGKLVPGIGISFKGLWRAYKEVELRKKMR